MVREDGRVRLLEDVELPRNGRVLVTILDDSLSDEKAISVENALSEDWNRDEEDAAWKHLQPGR
ncbi:hypothetical protein [Rubrobacter indicoceani]|uniref:hypothetical protein n=1 Tax=Rubrobacter indicoceani TaxID=2051957 RepID=UPI0019692D38|nr:hypothetical protein [Rubrobacter indicoceani]